jgi:hypothetical protein
VSDIVARLRRGALATNSAPATGLLYDAAAEIDRLRDEIRCATLTEEEREAVDNAARWLVAIQSADDPRAGECANTLRALLARLGGGK